MRRPVSRGTLARDLSAGPPATPQMTIPVRCGGTDRRADWAAVQEMPRRTDHKAGKSRTSSWATTSCLARLRSSRFSVSNRRQRRELRACQPGRRRGQQSAANGPDKTRRSRSFARPAPSSNHPDGQPRSRRDGTPSDKEWARCRSFQRGRSLTDKESIEPWAVPILPTSNGWSGACKQ